MRIDELTHEMYPIVQPKPSDFLPECTPKRPLADYGPVQAGQVLDQPGRCSDQR